MANLIYLDGFDSFISDEKLRGTVSISVVDMGSNRFQVALDGNTNGPWRYCSRFFFTREEAMQILHETFSTLRRAGVVTGDYLTGVCDNKDAEPLLIKNEDAARLYQQAIDMDDPVEREVHQIMVEELKPNNSYNSRDGLTMDEAAVLFNKSPEWIKQHLHEVEPLRCPECGSLDGVGNWDCPTCGYGCDEDLGNGTPEARNDNCPG